ncbi:Polysaccharide lyase family 1 protein [Mycena indigotica]|uniref:Polysaccharide lyase family 1 protein n=1 Tax=Mycena indigotica TaxID=2126181 RepID=A0A8H6SWD3_9AGAR|nr:Polysaccharide lyase family 1 protein [Mycena indigotica]KAF7306503.1 Polysaccharide lyase family 1 protein [Mycena indigotica]
MLRLFLSTLACLVTLASGLAFPGAVGFGSVATGGSTPFVVTSLADSGTGTFRDAVSVSGRNITFAVSGYIVLSSPVSLSSSITINGQTAPGNGIGVMGREISASGKNNIIIRNFRIRQGNVDSDTGKSAFNMGKASNVILDHCSVEYGVWDSIDAVGTANVTVSNSIIAYPIGQQFGAHLETGPATWYRNLWVSGHNRQPLTKANTQYINNIVYNYQAAYTVANTGGLFSHDIIGNYFIAGPSTTSANDDYFQMNANQKVFASGNFLDSNKNGALDGSAANSVGSAVVLSSAWNSGSVGLATLSPQSAYTTVLASVGASPRDEVDSFVISVVQSLGTKGAIVTNQASTGVSNNGYGSL